MNVRIGHCRMCERVTDFREVVQNGSAQLECVPCGDSIPLVRFVEAPLSALGKRPGFTEKRAEVLAGIQGEIDAITAKIAKQHAQIRGHASIPTDGIRVDELAELAEAKARIHELTLMSEHLVERNNARIESLESQLRTADHVANAISAARDIIAQRNNCLSDECGRLETVTRDLAVENSNLRRRLEAAERKAAAR